MSQALANNLAAGGPAPAKGRPGGALSEPGGLAAGVLAWLVGRPHGRWATPRGRWIRTVATAGLLVTAVAAWALALIQPWTFHPVAAAAALALPVGPPVRMRSSPPVNAELLAAGSAAVRPVRRDPFFLGEPPGRETIADFGLRISDWPAKATPDPHAPAAKPSQIRNPKSPIASLAAREVLDAIRRLRLEMTLVGPDGAAWAVIDGQEYRQGEVVGGLEIIEIQEGRVKLRKGEILCLLRMD
jgi:hypothetical protein